MKRTIFGNFTNKFNLKCNIIVLQTYTQILAIPKGVVSSAKAGVDIFDTELDGTVSEFDISEYENFCFGTIPQRLRMRNHYGSFVNKVPDNLPK